MEMAEGLAFRLMGIRVEDLTQKNRRNYRISVRQGVVISEIDGRSGLARIGSPWRYRDRSSASSSADS